MSQIHLCNDGTSDWTDRGTKGKIPCVNQGGEVGATENVSYDTISPLYTPPKKKLKIFIKNNSTLLILGGIVVGAFFLMKIK
jgi:hypothetical protein